MNEQSLHLAIKEQYSIPGDRLEVKVDHFIIDIIRDDLLIEIQTKNFSTIKKKLSTLVKTHKVRLVYPIPEKKWIIRINKSGGIIGRRKSPRRGRITDLFYELVRIPHLINETNFSLDVLLIDEEELRCYDGKGSWRRRGASIKDRKLLNVNASILFNNENDFLRFLPTDLDEPFTNRSLATQNNISIKLAQKITYCLEKMKVITCVGRYKRALLFGTTQAALSANELS